MTAPRRLRVLLATAIAGLALTLTGAPAATALPAPQNAGAVRTDSNSSVENFRYSSWDVDVDVDVTDEGRAIANITETIVAEFPETEQNRGIIRRIPQDYLGARTDPRNITVTDARGASVPFEVERGSDDETDSAFVGVLTGTDDYVHGRQTYVLNYTLDDVILHRDDQRADEFYWDLVPLNRAQAIDSATGSVTFSPRLAAQLTGAQRCYAGAFEAQTECTLETGDAPGSITVAPLPLAPHAGLTIAIGLTSGAVVQPSTRLPNFALDTLPLILGGTGIAASGVGLAAVAIQNRKRRGNRTVIAQYDVPAEIPPLIAGPIAGAPKPTPPAELVHLALLGVTRIEEPRAHDAARSKKKDPDLALRLLDPTRTHDVLDAETVAALFPDAEPGTVYEIPKEDSEFSDAMTRLAASGSQAALDRGYFERVRSPLGVAMGWVSLALVATLIVFIVLGFTTRLSLTPIITVGLALIAGSLGLIGMLPHRVLTPLGADTRNVLRGVREFIRVAEADRITMLQSVRTAERRSEGNTDVIQIYERLLPYAMLFGLEREWAQALATRYREDPSYLPLWYPGVAAGGFDRLDSSISQFSSSISAAATYSASSSGGSTGGGFAGGGGGGGFAGGR
ncbi:putative membrane protein DUF2207 [Leucobacter luti]|uniref:Putative membrane protein DUF2207 n=1 Tax=Leucobacter luti TaxID=340320 RepID=A0A4R6RTJ0_9MICO|nr:DUF2207 domain-containing protein [Leucobacter luti]TDP90211.1 putative membrane protein DUF2207 [Leucobacter luti]